MTSSTSINLNELPTQTYANKPDFNSKELEVFEKFINLLETEYRTYPQYQNVREVVEAFAFMKVNIPFIRYALRNFYSPNSDLFKHNKNGGIYQDNNDQAKATLRAPNYNSLNSWDPLDGTPFHPAAPEFILKTLQFPPDEWKDISKKNKAIENEMSQATIETCKAAEVAITHMLALRNDIRFSEDPNFSKEVRELIHNFLNKFQKPAVGQNCTAARSSDSFLYVNEHKLAYDANQKELPPKILERLFFDYTTLNKGAPENDDLATYKKLYTFFHNKIDTIVVDAEGNKQKLTWKLIKSYLTNTHYLDFKVKNFKLMLLEDAIFDPKDAQEKKRGVKANLNFDGFEETRYYYNFKEKNEAISALSMIKSYIEQENPEVAKARIIQNKNINAGEFSFYLTEKQYNTLQNKHRALQIKNILGSRENTLKSLINYYIENSIIRNWIPIGDENHTFEVGIGNWNQNRYLQSPQYKIEIDKDTGELKIFDRINLINGNYQPVNDFKVLDDFVKSLNEVKPINTALTSIETLLKAIKNKNIAVIEKEIENNVDLLNLKNKNDLSPLQLLVEKTAKTFKLEDKTKLVALTRNILNKYKDNYNLLSQDNNGNSLLHYAQLYYANDSSMKGIVDDIQKIATEKNLHKEISLLKNKNKQTAIEVFKIELEKSAKPLFRILKDNASDVEAIRVKIEANPVLLKAKDENGFTPFQHMIDAIEKTTDKNKKNDLSTFFTQCLDKYKDYYDLLSVDNNGNTILHHAALRSVGNKKTMQPIMDNIIKTADELKLDLKNKLNKSGQTPLELHKAKTLQHDNQQNVLLRIQEITNTINQNISNEKRYHHKSGFFWNQKIIPFKKQKYVQDALQSFNEAFDNENYAEAINAFKTFIICCMENKEGNNWHNSKTTKTGNEIIALLNMNNPSKNQLLAALLNKTGVQEIKYEELASTLHKGSAFSTAQALINPDKPKEELTIEQWAAPSMKK